MNSQCCDLKVLELAPVGQSERPGEFFLLRLEHPGWAGWQAGQFVMVRPASWGPEIIWGRPFSICSADSESLTLFFQVVGRGTSRLANLRPGDTVTLWGPLGNGFAVEPDTPTLLMGGGVGLAPFRGYIEQHPAPDNLSLFFAHRMPLGCYPYEAMADTVRAESLMERSPADLQGIISRIGELVAAHAEGLVLCCGPTPFMRTVQAAAAEHGVRCQVSLENRMACGVGACLGCVCKSPKGKHIQTCTVGPVFWSNLVEL